MVTTPVFPNCRHDQPLAERVAEMVFQGVKANGPGDTAMNFFRLLTVLTELSATAGAKLMNEATGQSVSSLGIPCYTTLAMRRIWDLAKACPQQALEWLSLQATRNRYVQTVLLTTLDSWVEPYLMAHPNVKVRTSAAFLVVSLVPSVHFRQAFRQSVAARFVHPH